MLTKKNIRNSVRHAAVLSAALFIVLALFSLSWAGVSNTVHNLSTTWSGGSDPRTIKADTEDRICVFCHTPHNASPAIPLWNHEMTGASYTMYDSEYLQRVDGGYDVPTELGFFPDVGYRSRMCLSCHDGTVALGSVYNLGGSSTTISMQGTGPEGRIPAASAGFIDTYLKDDHPVAIKYDEDAFIQFEYNSEQRPIELRTSDIPPIVGITPGRHYEVRLYAYPPETQGYVECTSCHDPHTETEKFLVNCADGDDCSTFAKRINVICAKCHEKTNWVGSAHEDASGVVIDNPAGEPQPIPGSSVAEAGCAACHKTHGGEGEPYLLRKSEEGTCFYSYAGSASTSCHGQTASGTGSLNIYDAFNRARAHPVEDVTTANRHTNLDVLDDGTDLRWDVGSGNEHAECVDCHNSHQARPGTHNDPPDLYSGWYPQNVTANTNDVSNVLLAVTGIDHPDDDPLWDDIDIASYQTMNSAEKEYQICFKCHSSYALRNFGTPVTSYSPTASGATVTDQAWEFSRGNKSAHPVKVTLNNMLTSASGSFIPGSYFPKPLTDAQMEPPWDNEGAQTMYCSDCHGADDETGSGVPSGPHGSLRDYMLKGDAQYWPTKSDGATLWTLGDMDTLESSNDLFCTNCHPDDPSLNNAHETGSTDYDPPNDDHDHLECVECHVAVPHGSKRSRLIGYGPDSSDPDPQPYDYNGTSLKIAEFKKASGPTSYTANSCKASCHATHSGSVTNPDP